jgi:outer membrane biosynthesis protein TonB
MTVAMTRSLIGIPLQLGRRGAGLAMSATVGVAQRGLSLAAHMANALLKRDEPDVDFDGAEHRPDDEPAAPPRRTAAKAPPAPEAPASPERQDAPEPAASAEPRESPQPPAPETPEPPAVTAEPAPKEEPRHVSEEATLVEEVAEPGAEDGAGAQVRVEEPWDGYRQMTAGDVVDRITGADAAVLAAVELYEVSARGRQTVLEAVRRELARAGRNQ